MFAQEPNTNHSLQASQTHATGRHFPNIMITVTLHQHIQKQLRKAQSFSHVTRAFNASVLLLLYSANNPTDFLSVPLMIEEDSSYFDKGRQLLMPASTSLW